MPGQFAVNPRACPGDDGTLAVVPRTEAAVAMPDALSAGVALQVLLDGGDAAVVFKP